VLDRFPLHGKSHVSEGKLPISIAQPWLGGLVGSVTASGCHRPEFVGSNGHLAPPVPEFLEREYNDRLTIDKGKL
jgi:hypothetical protein